MDTKRTVDNLWHIVEFDACPYLIAYIHTLPADLYYGYLRSGLYADDESERLEIRWTLLVVAKHILSDN